MYCDLFILFPAKVDYKVMVSGGNGNVTVEVVDDESGSKVGQSDKMTGSITVAHPKLWWPYSMSKQNFTNMYTLKVRPPISQSAFTHTVSSCIVYP